MKVIQVRTDMRLSTFSELFNFVRTIPLRRFVTPVWEVDKSVCEHNGKTSLVRLGRFISMKVLIMNLYLQVVPMAVIGSLGSSS